MFDFLWLFLFGSQDVVTAMPLGIGAGIAIGAGLRGLGQLYRGFQRRKSAGERKRETRRLREEARGEAGRQRGQELTDLESQFERAGLNIENLRKGFTARNALEQQFIDRLQTQSRTGALPVGELESQVSERVGEEARGARARQTGFAASRGLEGSGVTASLTGRIDASSMQSIARAARSIRIENEATKIGAQQQLGAVGARESDLRRQLASMIFSAESGRESTFFGGRSRARGTFFDRLAAARGEEIIGSGRAADVELAGSEAFADIGDIAATGVEGVAGAVSGQPQWRQAPDGTWVWA